MAERQNRLNLRLSDSMFERLMKVSDDMGLPATTVAAIAVAEYVGGKERLVKNNQQQMLMTSRQIGKVLQEELGKLNFDESSGDAVAVLQQLGLIDQDKSDK